VPWCATCDRFLSPPTVRADGTCPTCGGTIDRGHAHTSTATTGEEDARRASLPWHLWLLAAAVAVYLGLRAWPGIEWIIQQL
jgi:PHP family Zn ribbon phosphoesterase